MAKHWQSFDGVHRLDRFDGIGIYFDVQLEPRSAIGRVAVVVDSLEYASIREIIQQQQLDLHSELANIGIFSIGVFLDSGERILLTPSGTAAAKVPAAT